MQTEATRQNAFATPPVVGTMVVLASATALQTVDLASLANGPNTHNDSAPNRVGGVGVFVCIQADSQAVYFANGPTAASLAGLSSTATGANLATLAAKIEAGQTARVKITPGTRFAGIIGAATGGFVRIWISCNDTGS